jgi:uncharacterized protein YecE (DUF72 family)
MMAAEKTKQSNEAVGMAKSKTQFYCGTSNVVLPVPNKTYYPPEYQDKSRLHYYASIYNSVEINSSFKKIPLKRTLERWSAEVPEDFRFTFKLWSGITHARDLDYDVNDVRQFVDAVNEIGNKKGCLLVQFPSMIKSSFLQRVRRLLSDLSSEENMGGWNLAIEFRDTSWHKDRVYKLLEDFSATMVVHDMPKSATPVVDLNVSFEYLRFHGELGRYRGSYDEDVLRDYATLIRAWEAEGKSVFAYFNNTLGAAAINASDLVGFTKRG